MRKLLLDKEKYIAIMKAQGLPAALTALHRDQTGFEYETFEGAEGWQPDAWKDLEELREFSRDLWNLALTQPDSHTKLG